MTPAFLALYAVVFLVYAGSMIIQPVLPLLVLDQGGDAALVGLIVGVFSLPSVALRPLMGRAVDEWSNRRVLILGTVAQALACCAYLIPATVVLFLVRAGHGAGWAAFNTAGTTTLARYAPTERRAEATSYFYLMASLAQAAGPALGLTLLAATGGFVTPFAIAATCAVIALVVLLAGPRLPDVRTPVPPRLEGSRRAFLEPGAILPMTIQLLFSSVLGLFLTFMPLYALGIGIPIAELTYYYPVYGIVLVIARAVTARYLDRAGRGWVLVLGLALSVVSLSITALAQDIVVLCIGGAAYGLASSLVSPTAMALAIDRAEPGRLGAAMATYSLGYQLAAGSGVAVWGFIIGGFGFPAAFIGGITVQVVLLGIILMRRRSLMWPPAVAD